MGRRHLYSQAAKDNAEGQSNRRQYSRPPVALSERYPPDDCLKLPHKLQVI